MKKKILLGLFFLILMISCSNAYQAKNYQQLYGSAESGSRVISELPSGQVSFTHEVKPILDARCVACHACYDSPCQLKLTSSTGLERGATKQPVYDGERLFAAPPTRLDIDATTTKEWRDKQFYPVINERQPSAVAGIDNSLLAQLLLQKRRFPLPEQGVLDEEQYHFGLNDKYECPTMEKYSKYRVEHPQWGMPYALPGLALAEEKTILNWLEQGAKNDQNIQLTKQAKQNITGWEVFFNGDSLKQQLVSRYIYEHLFLGHIYFKDNPDDFYRLVRSKTPSGQAIEEINTVRPYDDPQVSSFYYRLRRIESTIVDKTHIIYELSSARRTRYQQLFFDNDFKVSSLPSYQADYGSNPFKTFAAIPNPIKYQFLLDDAKFFISGFIKGPVCRGQLALNVIQDHFWVLFFSPNHPYQAEVNEYFTKYNNILFLPGKEGDNIGLLGWKVYGEDGKKYLHKKTEFIKQTFQRSGGFTLDNIWKGNGWNQNATLTVFRHFDSATVEKGLIGDVPKTAWVLDYPLLERIHYLIVAGFNVYGPTTHQLASRTYMDFLRRDGEYNFLRFLPSHARQKIYNSWYQGLLNGRLESELLNLDFETAIQFKGQDYKKEFFHQVKSHLGQSLAPSRWLKPCQQEACKPAQNSVDNMIHQLARLKGKQISAIPEIAFLRVKMDNADDQVYTLLHNKDLTNVAFIFAEQYRLAPEQDTLTVVPGFIGSYPNFFFSVAEQDLNAFITALKTAQTSADKTNFYSRFGIRRNNPLIWPTLDWFNAEHKKYRGLEAGLFDMSRYHNL